MKPSITRLIRRAVELEGGKSQVNIAQARELIRCFAVAYYEVYQSTGLHVHLASAWLSYAASAWMKARRNQERKLQRKPKRKKK